MLHSRIGLLRKYLESVPASYLTSGDACDRPASSANVPGIDHALLRSIKALIDRLPLLIPADRETWQAEMLAERNDVSLVALLGTLNKTVKDVREVGRKFSVRSRVRSIGRRLTPSRLPNHSDRPDDQPRRRWRARWMSRRLRALRGTYAEQHRGWSMSRTSKQRAVSSNSCPSTSTVLVRG